MPRRDVEPEARPPPQIIWGLTGGGKRDLTRSVLASVHRLNGDDRAQVVAWFVQNESGLPEPVRRMLAEPLAQLRSPELSQKAFNQHGRHVAQALGLIPSSERRRPSGRPLDGVKGRKPRRDAKSSAAPHRADDYEAQKSLAEERGQQGLERVEKSREETTSMSQDEQDAPVGSTDPDTGPAAQGASKPLSAEKMKAIKEQNEAFIARAELGEGADPALRPASETLMNADVVCVDEDDVFVPAELPEGVQESDVVKTFVEPRTRYDFAVTVTRLTLDVEKKVVVAKDGTRRVLSGDVRAHGPKGFAVTWQALATLAVMVGQFAIPLNRLGTMLSTASKRFTATSLSRMAHYVAERLVPIYLVLMEQLADSDILAGDDTSCRVLEVSSYQAKRQANAAETAAEPPWRGYATTADAHESFEQHLRRNSELFANRAQGDRDARAKPAEPIPLKMLVGRELNFESPRKNGDGPKQSLNTTVLTGRADPDDPQSSIVFYRSHLGSLGNLLEMLLSRRKPDKRKLIVQADLSTTNLVTSPDLTERFDVQLAGCSAHARRPFAQYEDQDPKPVAFVLALFQMLAIHEDTLDRLGRNRENTLAVRGTDSRGMWEQIKQACAALAERWTKATPLGAGARYILKHYEKLTAYLSNPRLEPTNNLRERMLRTEKLIEKSSLFRRSIEGRVVLDIIRTVLQTAVAAGAPPHQYLVDILKARPEDIEARPEDYTPAAWLKRQRDQDDQGDEPAV